jgi:Holliday junction resolvase RusA-like endonuclease
MKSKTANSANLRLEDAMGASNILMEVCTSKKAESEEGIIRNIREWMENNKFEGIRDKELDVSILIYVNKQRYAWQDVDNISKVVLDAISNDKEKTKSAYLLEDDKQVIRLLAYKLMREEIPGMDTDEVRLSFRVHNPSKQMVLVDSKYI